MSPDNQLTVVQRADGRTSLAIVARPGLTLAQLPSTLPKSLEGMRQRFNAMGASTLSFDRDGTLLMDLAHVLAHFVSDRENEEGELSSFSWLVLIDKSGETFGSSSPVLADKVGLLVASWSAGEIERPTPVQIVRRTSVKKQRVYHDIQLI